ncbi:Uma2 family endonuclease [Kitasatospora sp. NPDC001119]|uniref:Uma2 family endonuclease n=1 Tax=Kitasatospora sp. MY 5-36 TaxID=1678027 RepID=UPI00131D99CC|nr:Uma2 family endonuclease [Kitasatospora sp. MY 5-36]
MTTRSARMRRVLEDLELPEGVRAEIILGEVVLTLSSDLTTNLIVASLIDQIPREAWDCWTRRDVSCWGDDSRLQPDLVVFERALSEAGSPTIVVEVVSGISLFRDHHTKRGLYAGAGIPAYLVVDPVRAVCVLMTEPSRATLTGVPDYLSERTSLFGEAVPVDPMGVSLVTADFPRRHSGRAVKSISSSTRPRSSGSRSL